MFDVTINDIGRNEMRKPVRFRGSDELPRNKHYDGDVRVSERNSTGAKRLKHFVLE